ncbi:hypothetical protein ACFLUG_04355 [Chloroflexota bacterium]
MENTFLFIGAMLVSFQYVGKIGLASSLFALPFTLPIRPLLRKVGLTIVWAIPLKGKWEITKPTSKLKLVKFYIAQVCWWILFVLSLTLLTIVTIGLSPVMFVYYLIGRPLLLINALLNLLFEKSMTPWKDYYVSIYRKNLQLIGKKTKFTDNELWKQRKEQGDKPFIAFIGLLFIVAGFILQLI